MKGLILEGSVNSDPLLFVGDFVLPSAQVVLAEYFRARMCGSVVLFSTFASDLLRVIETEVLTSRWGLSEDRAKAVTLVASEAIKAMGQEVANWGLVWEPDQTQ